MRWASTPPPLRGGGFGGRFTAPPAGLGLDAFPDVGVNVRPAGHVIDAVRRALEHPEDRVASRMNQALERAAISLQVDQHRRVYFVPVPGIVLMVLVESLDLAALGIKREHGGGVEIVAGMICTRPGGRVAGTPINCLGVFIVGARHPGGRATRFPVVTPPCVMAWLTFAGGGEGPPQFLAVIGVERNDVTPDAEFAAGA